MSEEQEIEEKNQLIIHCYTSTISGATRMYHNGDISYSTWMKILNKSSTGFIKECAELARDAKQVSR